MKEKDCDKSKTAKPVRKNELSRKMRDKLRLESRRWDQFSLLLAGCVALAAALGRHHALELGTPSIYGFLHWFLLCLAYPALELVGLMNLVLGIPDNPMTRYFLSREVLALALVDLATLAAVWALFRFYLGRRFGVQCLRVAGNFLLIVLCWGGLQLSLFLGGYLWSNGGFSQFHENLEEPSAVAPDTQSRAAK